MALAEARWNGNGLLMKGGRVNPDLFVTETQGASVMLEQNSANKQRKNVKNSGFEDAEKNKALRVLLAPVKCRLYSK